MEPPALAFNKTHPKESILTADTAPFECSVPLCPSNFTTLEEYQTREYKFYDCPDNSISQFSWRILCKVSRFEPLVGLRVCSRHFALLEEENKSQDLEVLEEQVVVPETLESKIQRESKAIEALRHKLVEKKRVIDRKNQEVDNLQICLRSLENSSKKLAKTKPPFKLQSKLTSAQIELLKGEKKKVFWSDDDLAQAFSLRHMAGKDFYVYLKNTLNYPLPALACVQVWAGAEQDNPLIN